MRYLPKAYVEPRPPRVPDFVPKIPKRALPAWAALTIALTAETAVVPCTSVLRDEWTSDDPRALKRAATACSGCTVIQQCSRYADLAGVRDYVYGGRDRSAPKTPAPQPEGEPE